MKKMSESVGAWLRGLVWTAMIFGCAWAGAQNYIVSPSTGRLHAVAMGSGEGVGLGHGVGVEGAQNAEPAPKDDLFANTEVFAKNATHVTEITMDPDTLNMVGGSDEHKARNTVLQVVRTYTYDQPGMYNMADVDAIRSKLNTGDWHCSVHVRDLKTGSGSDVCGKHRTDGMKETAIIEVEPKELTFIHTIRRGGGPGSSDVGFFPMLPGIDGLPAIAMMDPEALADMEIGLHGMRYAMGGYGPMMLTMPGMGNFSLNWNDGDKAFKVLKNPISPEEMKKFNEQMKDFNGRLKMYKDKGVETAPTPSTPLAPQTPQTAPVPMTPQTPQ